VKTIEIDGKRYDWKEIRRLRREQIQAARKPQPTLFELQSDSRPVTQKTAADRFLNPTLFEKGR
jgi:hypothetical protein